MPSATTADSSDSMAPSKVKEMAAGRTARIFQRQVGQAAAPEGRGDAAELRADGLDRQIEHRRRRGRQPDGEQHRRPVRSRAAHPEDDRDSRHGHGERGGVTLARASQRAGIFSSSSPGSCSSVSPKSSLIWLAKMMTAIPAVKPTVTGKGMNLMKVPSLSIPAAASISPDRKVARISPSIPCCATVAATSTMKAPAGPPIWKRDPPSERDEEAADDGSVEPLRRRRAGGDGDGH